MKRRLVLFVALSMLIGACTVDQEDSPTAAAPLATIESTPGPGSLPAATVEMVPQYPAPPASSGPASGSGSGPYPEPPSELPTRDPYPAGRAVIYRAFGEQCAESAEYENVDEAVAELEGNGITVLKAEEVELAVCAACGCPTSEHIRAEIEPGDLNAAQELGWSRE